MSGQLPEDGGIQLGVEGALANGLMMMFIMILILMNIDPDKKR